MNRTAVFSVYVIISLLTIFSVSASGSATPITIILSNCTLSGSSGDCGDSLSASCYARAQSNATGAAITGVQFMVNGRAYTGDCPTCRSSNNFTAGTWTATVTVDKAFNGAPITLQTVSATASDASSCTASNNIASQSTACDVTFINPISAANLCVCTYTKTTGAVSTDNSRTFYVTPSAACADQTVTSYKEFADYCDPGWTVQSAACLNTFNDTTDKLKGYMLKSYVSGDGGTCCAATGNNVWFNHNSGSDCTAPVDAGAQVPCRLDFWKGAGDGAYENGISNFNVNSYSSYSATPAGSSFEPLIWDFNGDGNTEILLFSGSTIYMYSNKLVFLSSTVLSGTISGQPTLLGVTVNNAGQTVLESWVSKTSPPLVVIPRQGGAGAVVQFMNITSTFTNVISYTLPSTNSSNRVSGVTCHYDYCYFYSDNLNVYQYQYSNQSTYVTDYNKVYTGSVWANNYYPTSNVSYVGTAPGIAKVDNIAEGWFIFVPQYLGVTSANKHVELMVFQAVSSYIGPSVRIGLYTEAETSANQLSLRQIGKMAVSKENVEVSSGNSYWTVGLAVEETYDSTSPKLKLGTYQFRFMPSQTVPFTYGLVGFYLTSANANDMNMIPLWKNVRTSSDEGISNVVDLGNGNMAVRTSVKLASLPLGVGGVFSAPTVEVESSALTRSPRFTTYDNYYVYWPKFVSDDKQYVYEDWGGNRGQPGGSSYGGGYTNQFRISDGALGYARGTGCYLGGCGLGTGSAYYEFEGKKRYLTSRQDKYFTAGFSGAFACADVDDFFSPLGTCSEYAEVSGQTCPCGGCGTYLPTYQVLGDVIQLDGNLYTLISTYTNAPAFCPNNPIRFGILEVEDPKTIKYWPVSVFPGLGTVDWGDIIAYDAARDVLLTRKYLVQGFKAGFLNQINDSNVSAIVTLSSPVAEAAFNFDWTTPRYIGADGKKYKIDLSTVPATISSTTLSCDGTGSNRWRALFYNSDTHILGYKYNITLGSLTSSAPMFSYCDFSNEGSPTTYDYTNNRMLAYSCTPQGTNCNYEVQLMGSSRYSVKQYANNQGIYDGVTGEWYLIEIGFTWAVNVSGAYPYDPQASGDFVFRLSKMNSLLVSAQNSTSSSSSIVHLMKSSSVTGAVASGFAKTGPITAADYNNDGDLDIVTPTGLYDVLDGSFEGVALGMNQIGEIAIPVDLNADNYMDILTATTNASLTQALKAKVSNPDVIPVVEGNLGIISMRCTPIENTNKVDVQLTASAPDPAKVTVLINPGDGQGTITQGAIGDGLYTVTYLSSGTYTLTATVSTTGSSAKVSQTCSVTVAVPSALEDATGKCSLGADGEFQYADSIVNHGWSLLNPSASVKSSLLVPKSGYLTVTKEADLKYALSSCNYETVVAEAGVYLGKATTLQFSGTGGQTVSMTFDKTTGQVYDENANILGEFSDTGALRTISLSVDKTNGVIRVYLDGAQVSAKQGSIDVNGVVLLDGGQYDYVRVRTEGNMIRNQRQLVTGLAVESLLAKNPDTSALRNCDLDAELSYSSRAARMSYPDVASYCSGTDEGGCEFLTLTYIASVYPNCAKQAYNYCVYESFATSQGVDTSAGCAGAEGCNESATLAGGTVCMSLLGASAAWNGVLQPAATTFWSMFTSNTTTLFIIMIIVVVVIVPIAMIAAKRRRQ